MLIALLVILGVDLTVVVAVAALAIARKRWLKGQPGEFAGAIRLSTGEVDGVSAKWRRGSARWVRDVLVWSRAPLMFRSELIAIDSVVEERHARSGEVKRLGDNPVVFEFAADGATILVAARSEDRELVAAHIAGADRTGSPAST